ncbi:MAG: biopolymer transporter Tol [Verrucomicrobia bacterium]|nr:biopolymer transporter Tol [Verrucomicrobiota bacterium]
MYPPLVHAQQGPVELGTIEQAVNVQRLNVRLSSPNPQAMGLLQRAFALHGGFEVRASGNVDFEITVVPNERQAELIITSAGRELLRQQVSGTDWRDATLRAADTAVRRTLGIPGFFAGMVAFISDRTGHSEVYVSDMFFERPRQLTRDRALCLLPNLSPDGSRLLYTSYHRNGFPDIFSIDLRSNRRDVFASFRGLNTGAVHSPDGRQVAMILSGSGNSELYVSDAQGQNIRRLTRTAGLEADPTWSPDGRRLAFTSDEHGRPQIFTINADGTGMRRLPTNISRNCSEPNWNPVNADQIIFTAAIGREFELVLWEFSRNASRVLTQGTGDAVHPTWLRDGRHVIYTERTARYSRLMVLDTVTGRSVRLSPDSFNNASMATFAYPGL